VVGCVPNLSEGRDSRAIERIAGEVREAGCRVLDVHRDPDHHRSVLTIVGERANVVRGILSMVETAVQEIDLRRHRGVHPRIGAVDVIPFVPIAATPFAECVDLAREVGAQIAGRLEIPVFLYEHAALRPECRNLADVRRGGSAGVAERLRARGGKADFGPDRLHPTAGAIAVGARRFLVAYNVNLATDDVSVARTIAATIREANGGLPGVKALGLSLPSRALTQVSMNLTDVERTRVVDAFDWVAEEATRHGVEVLESEIVGLAPRVALRGATTDRLQLTRDLADVELETLIEAG